MTPREGKWLGVGIVVLGGILFVAGVISNEGHFNWVSAVGALIGIGGYITWFTFWRCPSCGALLATRSTFVEYCHRCGADIDQPRFQRRSDNQLGNSQPPHPPPSPPPNSLVPEDGWRCTCGLSHAQYVGTCGCGKTKDGTTEKAEPLKEEKREDSMKIITSKEAPAAIGPYSQATAIGGVVYTSGQIPLLPETGELVDGGIKEQTEQVIRNLSAVLTTAGSDLAHVVKTTCFLTDMENFAAFNEVYAEYFTSKPARSTVAVRALPKGALVEIEAVAEIAP